MSWTGLETIALDKDYVLFFCGLHLESTRVYKGSFPLYLLLGEPNNRTQKESFLYP